MLEIMSDISGSLFLFDQFTAASNILISGAQNELRDINSTNDLYE